MHSNNIEIRVELVKADLKQWELARLMGVHEESLSRKLRYELTPEEKEDMIHVIREYDKERRERQCR